MKGQSRSCHPAWPGLEDAQRVGEMLSTVLGPAGSSSSFVLLPGAGGGSVRVVASGVSAMSGNRLRPLVSSPGVLTLLERSASSVDNTSGSGATTLLTMLAGAVQRIHSECRDAHHGFGNLQRVSRALAEHGSWVLHDVIFPTLREVECRDLPLDFWSLVTAVLHTAIAGKVGHRSADAGVKVAVEWMRLCYPNVSAESAPKDLPRRLPIVMELGAEEDRSYVVRGVILDAGLSHGQMPVRLTNAKFVVLRCALKDELQPTSCTSSVEASQHEDAQHLRNAPRQAFAAFVRSLKMLDVCVVVTTAHIDEEEACAFSHARMQAIGDVDMMEAQALCLASDILPLPGPSYLARGGGGSRHVGVAASCQQGCVGGRRMMHFDISKTDEEAGSSDAGRMAPHVLMLRAQERGAGELLSECLQRAFRVLRLWLAPEPSSSTSSSQSPRTDTASSARTAGVTGQGQEERSEGAGLVAGAGAVELAVVSKLWRLVSEVKGGAGASRSERRPLHPVPMHQEQQLLCRIFADALLAVPISLARNASVSSARGNGGGSSKSDCSPSIRALRDAKRALLCLLADAPVSADADLWKDRHSLGILVSTALAPLPASHVTSATAFKGQGLGGWWFGDATRAGVLEPISVKTLVITEFHSLLCQLLRLGGTVRVSQLLPVARGAGTRVQGDISMESDSDSNFSSSSEEDWDD